MSSGEGASASTSDSIPLILRTPLRTPGVVPALVPTLDADDEEAKRWRARFREYEQQIRAIRRRALGPQKPAHVRAEGLRELAEFTDPAAFWPMFDVLQGEGPDVRRFLLDHFAAREDAGEAMIAMVAIHAESPAFRAEALARIPRPASDGVLRVIDTSLRDRDGDVANAAANLVSALDAVQALPLLIYAQAVDEPRVEPTGDLAWIAIGTQTTYVANLIPAVGDASGGFQPVLGMVTEGSVLSIRDAVVISYRTDVHRVLVSMSTRFPGPSMAEAGYDIAAWHRWFNEIVVPHMQREQRIRELADSAATTS